MEFTELSLAGKSSNTENEAPPSVDLHLKHPLPSDWEQCLDLQSGKMYYVDRKTSRKSWNRPGEQNLDLELNISTGYNNGQNGPRSSIMSNNNTIALACSNCHLLVILSRSSPSCPNCKYVHSLAPSPKPRPPIGPSTWI